MGYKSVTEVSRITGISKIEVNNACHKQGQKYAFRLKPRGRWYIDLDKFKQSVERRNT